MALLNVISILLLSRPGLRCLKDYERQRRENTRPVFHEVKPLLKMRILGCRITGGDAGGSGGLTALPYAIFKLKPA